jgi:N6-L-threonylcarbamoyladenine synthase
MPLDFVSGGVSANKSLRKEMEREAKERKIRFIAPELEWSTDNAAMVAASSYVESLMGIGGRLKRMGTLR